MARKYISLEGSYLLLWESDHVQSATVFLETSEQLYRDWYKWRENKNWKGHGIITSHREAKRRNKLFLWSRDMSVCVCVCVCVCVWRECVVLGIYYLWGSSVISKWQCLPWARETIRPGRYICYLLGREHWSMKVGSRPGERVSWKKRMWPRPQH